VKQGEIWIVDLNPVKGNEQAGQRPVVILSGNLLNQHLPLVIVSPLTTKIKRYKGNPILKPSKVNGLKGESELHIFHIRSISKARLVKNMGDIDHYQLLLAVKTLNDLLKY
jgi:mRNA interferase MazF